MHRPEFAAEMEANERSSRITVATALGIFRRRWWLFLLPLVSFVAAGSLVVRSIPSVYQSYATILVESQRIPEDLVKSTVSQLASERIQVIEQLVKARDNVARIAKKYGILERSSDLTDSQIIEKVKSRIVIAPLEQSLMGRQSSGRLTVAFRVSYEDENPSIAAKVANELVTVILDQDAKNRAARASETTNFLEQEASRLGSELTTVDQAISEFRVANSDRLPEKLQFNMSLLERSEDNLTELKRELLSIAEEERLLKLQASIASTGELGNTRLSTPQQLVAALRAEIAAKSAIYSPSHPEMRQLQRQLRALQTALDTASNSSAPSREGSSSASGKPGSGETSGILNSSPAQQVTDEKINSLIARRGLIEEQQRDLSASVDKLRQIVVSTPETGSRLSELERKRAALQKSVDDTNEKLAQARLGERLEEDQRGERFEVIEQPVVPVEPSKPNKPKFYALVLIMAAAASSGIAGLAEYLDARLHTVNSLVRVTGSQPLAVIPVIRTRRDLRRRRILASSIIVLLMVFVGMAMWSIDRYVMPLDELKDFLIRKIDQVGFG